MLRSETIWKTLVVAALLVAGQLLVGALLTAALGAPFENPPSLSATLMPMVAAALLTVACLVYLARRSSLGGHRLFLALFSTIVGINVVLIEVEAALFLHLSPQQLRFDVLSGTLAAALLSLLLVVAFGRHPRPTPTAPDDPWTAGRWVRRLGLAAFCYMTLYFVAGILIYPLVKEFYATQEMPGPWIVPFQLLRGALYVLFALPLVRSLVGGRRQVSLAIGFSFPVLAGVAALLIPNPVMPAAVRGVHLLEIGWSNFAFGALVGFLFWRRQGPVALSEASRRPATEPEQSASPPAAAHPTL